MACQSRPVRRERFLEQGRKAAQRFIDDAPGTEFFPGALPVGRLNRCGAEEISGQRREAAANGGFFERCRVLAGDQQHPGKKNETLVGVGVQALVEALFSGNRQLFLALERLTRSQRSRHGIQIFTNVADGFFHAGVAEIRVGAIVCLVNQARLGRQRQFIPCAPGQAGGQVAE